MPHTVHEVVMSRAFIARLAEALDRMQAEPIGTVACPAIFADYQVTFSVSRASRPVVVVSSNITEVALSQVTDEFISYISERSRPDAEARGSPSTADRSRR